MMDTQAKRPLRVSVAGKSGPYLRVPLSQLKHIQGKLDDHQIRYWVDSDAISMNGKPAVAVINFGLSGNSEEIQRILDISSD